MSAVKSDKRTTKTKDKNQVAAKSKSKTTTDKYVTNAKILLKLLVDRILDDSQPEKPIHYKELAELAGLPTEWPALSSCMGKSLHTLGEMLDALKIKVPVIQFMVVLKRNNLPSDGLGSLVPGYTPDLPIDQKRALVKKEQKRVIDYGKKWLDVEEQINTN